MKISSPFLLLALATYVNAGDGALDLTILQNYANQGRPAYITRDNTPADNPITDQGATLGRVLFHDKRLSRNDTISCASCHIQSLGFGDTATASIGVNGTTGRHSMRLINARFAAETRFFWDERAASAEVQSTQPVRDHVEMGFSGTSGDPAFADLVVKLTEIEEYRVLFSMTYGDPAIDESRIQKALAQFVRGIQSFDSKYDAGRALVANDGQAFPNFTANENAGKALFLTPPPQGGAGCAGCHVPPEFAIDPNSRNNGVIASIGGGADLTNTRAPSLRNLVGPGGTSNGGFMHDGSFATLDQVISHYNAIPANSANPAINNNLDARLRGPGGTPQNLNLTQTQKDNLAAFLRTLTGTDVYTNVKWSNPFTDANELELVILPTSTKFSPDQVSGTATVSAAVAQGLSYQFQSSSDLRSWTTHATVTPDAQGNLSRSVVMEPGVFYRFTYTPPSP